MIAVAAPCILCENAKESTTLNGSAVQASYTRHKNAVETQ